MVNFGAMYWACADPKRGQISVKKPRNLNGLLPQVFYPPKYWAVIRTYALQNPFFDDVHSTVFLLFFRISDLFRTFFYGPNRPRKAQMGCQ